MICGLRSLRPSSRRHTSCYTRTRLQPQSKLGTCFQSRRLSLARSAATALLALLLLAWAAPAFASTLAWNPNPETNIAGYRVAYGTQTGVYGQPIDVGNVTSWNVSVPAPGQYFFVVQAYDTDGQFSVYSSEKAYTVTTPVISSLTPASGAVGASVVIAGSEFGTLQGTVSFNGVSASPTVWSDTSITVPVPSGATTGSVVVTVDGIPSNGVTFTVVPTATISSLSPATGAVSAPVTITGTNFGVTRGTSTVTFNGVSATPTSWSAASIAVPVPSGATTGTVNVTVGGVASNGMTFTVVPTATITSLSPASGEVGATVTITGTNFGSPHGTSAVSFNGVTATPTSWSATSIAVQVPGGATTGNVVVTVGGVASTGVTFTVVPAPTSQPTMEVDRASLNFGAVNSGTAFTSQSPAQTVNIAQIGTQNPVTWTATSDLPWLTVSPTSGSGPAALSIGVQYASTVPPAGSASVSGAITVTYTGSATATSTVSARLNLPAASTPPTGTMDTPAAGATGLQGSIAVTGWAVDDIMVDRVELWRDLQPGEPTVPFVNTSDTSDPRNGKVLIGNATFVSGARPDIEALYPTMPLNSRGGWGYMLLTWGLWNQGNGTYTLYAFAFDAEGQVATLGQKTIGVANALANKPFGAIDTPAVGGNASGTTVNFGWALTPNSGGPAGTTCTVPATGVQVTIDSGPLQPVVFGDARSDIAGAFAGFTNSAAAGGHFTFDTTALANGVHSIAWLVTDDCNRADGVGSRFFTVQNASVVAAPAVVGAIRAAAGATRAAPLESVDPIVVARGFGELGVTVHPDSTGQRVILLKQDERVEVRLPNGYDEAWQLALGDRRALPIGATWDPASHTFTWQPAPGFLGDYEILFVRGTETIRVLISVSEPISRRRR
jgi:IPT/TIG domain